MVRITTTSSSSSSQKLCFDFIDVVGTCSTAVPVVVVAVLLRVLVVVVVVVSAVVGVDVTATATATSTAAAAMVVAPDTTSKHNTGRRGRGRRGVALVTGSTDGIGLTTAKHLAANHDYTVLIHGRDEQRISNAVNVVQEFCSRRRHHHQNNYDRTADCGAVVALPATDISSMKGCYQLVDHVENAINKLGDDEGEDDSSVGRLSVLMNNAGVYSEKFERTDDGLEMTFAVNVLAPFILTSMLLPQLTVSGSTKSSASTSSTDATRTSRIVIASSISQSWSPIDDWDDIHLYRSSRRSPSSYSAHRSYSESKLLDAMLTMEFHERLHQKGLLSSTTCNCLDPGTVNTKMLLAGWGRIGIDPEDALDQTWLCTSPDIESVSGKYFVNQQERLASSPVYNIEERQQLWKLLTDLAPDPAAMWL